VSDLSFVTTFPQTAALSYLFTQERGHGVLGGDGSWCGVCCMAFCKVAFLHYASTTTFTTLYYLTRQYHDWVVVLVLFPFILFPKKEGMVSWMMAWLWLLHVQPRWNISELREHQDFCSQHKVIHAL
jgi:hypothetical protein